MPATIGPWQGRPSASQSGSTSAAFAFATEAPPPAQQTPPTNGASLQTELSTESAAPQPINQPTTNILIDRENGEATPTAAGAVADEIDQLENEVVHFMNLSFEEREKSEALAGRLASVTKEKEDLERQIDELDQQLGRIDSQGQDDGPSATSAGETISRVNAKVNKLRATAQSLENGFNILNSLSNQDTEVVAELKEQLRTTREQLAQKTQEGELLRQELDQTTRVASSEKATNEGLLSEMKALKQQYNVLSSSYALTGKKLAEAQQTVDTLGALVKQKDAELEDTRKVTIDNVQAMRQEINRKQKEIDNLYATQHAFKAGSETAQPVLKIRTQRNQATHRASDSIRRRQLEESEAVGSACAQPNNNKDAVIKKLTEDLRNNQMRRVRAVAIAIDLSGSAAGSLTGGIKKLYAHLLGTLQRSPCQTYVMTVVHGPGDKVSVKSRFSDSWATHEKVLEGQEADGMEQHVECLRVIKEVAVSTGLVLDLQVVLLGDSNTNVTSHVGSEEVCADFSASNPTVHIHSVAVKTGSAEETETYWNNLEAWHPWNYASGTGGNMIVWWQNSPLPDLSRLVY